MKKLILSGNVQGVRCRGFCQDIAKIMNIHGSASNLVNGNVQVILNTTDETLIKQYIDQLKTNNLNIRYWGKITQIEIKDYQGIVKGDYNF